MGKGALSKKEILDTAADCFMERGYFATSVDDVARAMGSTKGRIYHHYSSKIELFFAVHREGMRLLFDAVVPATQQVGPGIDVLEAMLRAHARALLEHQTYESVVAQGVNLHRFGSLTPSERQTLDELIASRDEFEGLFKAQVSRAREDRTLGDVDRSVAVKMILGGIQWSLIWYRPERSASPHDLDSLAEKMVAVLMVGLRSREN